MAGSTKVKQPNRTEQLKVQLKDGEFHARNDLIEVLDCKNPKLLQWVVRNLRKALPDDEIIICELVGRVIGYRWARRKG